MPDKKLVHIVLDLTDEESALLRNSTSDLGTNDKDCISLQLKIANALLDAREVQAGSPFLINSSPRHKE